MNSSDFLNALSEAMPTNDELKEYGLNSEEIDGVQASFRFIARNLLNEKIAVGSELERMIVEYDCSTVEVGLIRFLPRPQMHHNGVQVAYCEADPIIVNASGVVTMHSHDDPDASILCAADSQSFLDALSVFIKMRREKSHWKGRVEEAANLCSMKAGGGNSIPFFLMLCGYLA